MLASKNTNLTQDDIDYIRNVQFHGPEELQQFKEWCQCSPYKKIHGWYSDKIPYPWFFPSLNKHASKMDPDD